MTYTAAMTVFGLSPLAASIVGVALLVLGVSAVASFTLGNFDDGGDE